MHIDKKLLIDKSGWNPFCYAFSKEGKESLNIKEINDFFEKYSIAPVIVGEALKAGEFTHSFGRNLFSGTISSVTLNINQNGIGEPSFNTDGTVTSKNMQFSGGVEITSTSDFSSETVLLTEQTKFQNNSSAFSKYEKAQKFLWETSKYWESISKSIPDLSIIYTNRELLGKKIQHANLVNDWHLREQIFLEGSQVYGSSTMLADMVLSGVINVQTGTYVYYQIWNKYDNKWIPNKNNLTKEKYKFKEILELEREKIKNGKNFFLPLTNNN